MWSRLAVPALTARTNGWCTRRFGDVAISWVSRRTNSTEDTGWAAPLMRSSYLTRRLAPCQWNVHRWTFQATSLVGTTGCGPVRPAATAVVVGLKYREITAASSLKMRAMSDNNPTRSARSRVEFNRSTSPSNSGFTQPPRLDPLHRLSGRGISLLAWSASVASPAGPLVVESPEFVLRSWPSRACTAGHTTSSIRNPAWRQVDA